jgi:hypothetical protein
MTPTGQRLKGNNRETYWTSGSLVLGSWPGNSLTSALNELLDLLTPRKKLFGRIRAGHGRVEFFVGWYFNGNSGDVIDVAILKRLSDFGIDLSLDIYPPDKPQRGI